MFASLEDILIEKKTARNAISTAPSWQAQWSKSGSLCKKELVNALPKITSFLRVFKFLLTGNVHRVSCTDVSFAISLLQKFDTTCSKKHALTNDYM